MSQWLAYPLCIVASLPHSNKQRPHEDQHPSLPRTEGAQFGEPQARTLVEIPQAAGVVEPEPPESEVDRIEQYSAAEPFQPFVIEMSSGSGYRIERHDQCGFDRHGSIQLSGVGEFRWCLLDPANIIRVTKL